MSARTVGGYEILDVVGEGGMATVYRARQLDLQRIVALKELSGLRRADGNAVRRFLRESRLTGSLGHPNVVTVHDYFESDGVPYIAMEYVEGGSLRPLVGDLSLPQIAGVLEGILSALAYAERRGIVHRDLKPENVLLTSDGRVKVADFGIAKATGAAALTASLTVAGNTVGTPLYMAPEQAMGKEVGPWTDLYSTGMLTFELIAGRTPFDDTDDPMGVLMRQVNDPVPSVRDVEPSAGAELSAWIDQLVRKDPAERTQTAARAWDELEEIALHLAGPRWRRAAAITPHLLPPPEAVAPLAATVAPRRALRPLAAETPATAPLPAEPSAGPGRARRLRRIAIGTLAVSAVAAAAFGGTGGGAGRTAGGPERTAAVTPARETAAEAQAPTSGTGASYTRAVASASSSLQDVERTQGPRLTSAPDPAARATAARTLAGVYDAVANQLSRLDPGPPGRDANVELVAALRDGASVYRRAARAARSDDAKAYLAATAEIPAARARLDAVLAVVPQAGPPATREQRTPADRSGSDDSGVGDSRSDDPSDDEEGD